MTVTGSNLTSWTSGKFHPHNISAVPRDASPEYIIPNYCKGTVIYDVTPQNPGQKILFTHKLLLKIKLCFGGFESEEGCAYII